MKNLNIIAAALASTVALASPVFAEWTEVKTDVFGNTTYIEFDTVEEKNGYVYYWELLDRLSPDSAGDLSYKSLVEVECGTPRKRQSLSEIWYAQPMASGRPSGMHNLPGGRVTLSPDSVFEIVTNAVCDYAGK